MQLCRIIYYSFADLHVSSDIFAHHHEHLNCITASCITHLCRCRLVIMGVLVLFVYYIMMHGNMNIRFINAKQAKGVHTYKSIKRKLYRTTTAIWFNKTCRDKQLTHNYINIRINDKNR